MIHLTHDDLKRLLDKKIFHLISEVADSMQLECYVVGGYVRDLFLERPSKDIDVVTVGSGIVLAKALAEKLGRGAHLSVFANFGTAQVKYHGLEVEFVGARRESYNRGSRKPIVEDGTLEDDPFLFAKNKTHPDGMGLFFGDPERTRTVDLQRDRLAC